MNINGQVTIFKNDKGIYKLPITNKEIQENGEEKTIYMQINVGFRKGVEVKNKTKINIKDGFLTFFKIDSGEVTEGGKPIFKKFPKVMVMDFDVIEEGTDEVYHSKDYSNKQHSFSDDAFGGYYSDNSDDELPF